MQFKIQFLKYLKLLCSFNDTEETVNNIVLLNGIYKRDKWKLSAFRNMINNYGKKFDSKKCSQTDIRIKFPEIYKIKNKMFKLQEINKRLNLKMYKRL